MQFHPRDLSELDDLTEEHLGFSALSDGLGFAKKTDARAEAPSQKDVTDEESPHRAALSRSGTGAVAAGPARFVTGSMAAPAPAPVLTPKAKAANILQEPAAAFSIRCGAFLLDAMFILVPFALAWWLSFGALAGEFLRLEPRLPALLFAAIFAAYFLLSESFGGQSLGKMLLGLRVVEDDKYQKPVGLRHTAARIALFAVGLLLGGLGLIASFWDNKRRPWHDRYSGSIVRRSA